MYTFLKTVSVSYKLNIQVFSNSTSRHLHKRNRDVQKKVFTKMFIAALLKVTDM